MQMRFQFPNSWIGGFGKNCWYNIKIFILKDDLRIRLFLFLVIFRGFFSNFFFLLYNEITCWLKKLNCLSAPLFVSNFITDTSEDILPFKIKCSHSWWWRFSVFFKNSLCKQFRIQNKDSCDLRILFYKYF